MSAFFIFKRVVGMVVRPLAAVFILMALGVLLSRVLKWKKLGWLCHALAVVVLFLTSFPPAARFAGRFLERDANPVLAPVGSYGEPFAIVVLGNGVAFPGDSAMPALTRLNDTARARLAEGVRLSLMYPKARLITTGYGLGLESCAAAMAMAAVELGVDPSRIRRIEESMDTAHEAKLVTEMAGDNHIVVVTSAVHMPRAMKLFAAAGANAAAAPCDYIAPISEKTLSDVNRARWRPQGKSISDSEAAWHEWMGLAYLALSGEGNGGGDE